MRWLHLTDLHFGKRDETQLTASKSLVKQINRVCVEEVDAVFLTGDIAYSGAQPEYAAFREWLLEPLRGLDQFKNATFFAVPGNHDAASSWGTPIDWRKLPERRQKVFFEDCDEGKRLRSHRADAFKDYAKFCVENGIVTLDPALTAAKSEIYRVRNEEYRLILVNTALFSDPDVSDESVAPPPTTAIRREIESAEQNQRIIILAHHPFTWFLREKIQALRSLVLDNRAIYLHGHTHELLVTVDPDRGLQALGFGAAYADSPDVERESRYSNTFALADLSAEHLDTLLISWDSHYGRWHPTAGGHVDLRRPSLLFPGGWTFPVPTASKGLRAQERGSALTVETIIPERVWLAEEPGEKIWRELLSMTSLVRSSEQAIAIDNGGGAFDFRITRGGQQELLSCDAAPGHVLSYQEVQVGNTRMDTDDLAAMTFVALGDCEAAARALASKLAQRKRFEVITNKVLARKLADSREVGEAAAVLRSRFGESVSVKLVVFSDALALSIEDAVRLQWFLLAKLTGEIIPEADALVRRFRQGLPAHRETTYGAGAAAVPEPAPLVRFDAAAYFAKCRDEFDVLQYAGLATTSLRMPAARLSDVYVDANAQLSESLPMTELEAVSAALALENLDGAEPSYGPEAAFHDLNRVAIKPEVQRAAAFYRNLRSVLLVGDPGSGKTCFVKNEILAYCSHAGEEASWYGNHVPIFVPLAEAAERFAQGASLVQVAAELAARRGYELPLAFLENACREGKVAFFYDGLDEVVDLEVRSRLLRAIGEQIEQLHARGNRFVVTSRPASVLQLQIPPHLSALQLRGLSRSESRQLAANVLSAEQSAEAPGFRFGEADASRLDEFMETCVDSRGIGQLARNPLLLTLLVIIFSNHGRPGARRHKVYAQAVATLASVRSRSQGHAPVSEADLRVRLGPIAVEILSGHQMTLARAASIVAPLIRSKGGLEERTAEAARFLRLVAESTGLIVLQQRTWQARPEECRLDFMHRSFLEYYAALEKVRAVAPPLLAELVRDVVWRDVVMIAAGVLGEQGDVAALLLAMIRDESPRGAVGATVLDAFDAALECDVPPEEVQNSLLLELRRVLRTIGPADGGVREACGERLANLVAAIGPIPGTVAAIEDALATLNAEAAAAHVEMLGYVVPAAEEYGAPLAVEALVAQIARRPEMPIRVALCRVLGRAATLRSPGMVQFLRDSLAGPRSLKLAALAVLEDVPAIALEVRDDLVKLLGDGQPDVAAKAAQALLSSGVVFTTENEAGRLLLLRTVQAWERATRFEVRECPARLPLREVESLLTSPRDADRTLGLRLLPWVDLPDEVFRFRALMSVVRSNAASTEVVAALNSIRLSSARSVLTDGNLDIVLELLKAKNRAVRRAAVQLLGSLPASRRIAGAIIEFVGGAAGVELRDALLALAAHASEPGVRPLLMTQAMRLLPKPNQGVGSETSQGRSMVVLGALDVIGPPVPERLALQVLGLADTHRTPERLRRYAIRAFARIAPIDRKTCKTLCAWIEAGDPLTEDAVASGARTLLRRCEQAPDAIAGLGDLLGRLQLAIWSRWGPRFKRQLAGHDDMWAKSARSALLSAAELAVGLEKKRSADGTTRSN